MLQLEQAKPRTIVQALGAPEVERDETQEDAADPDRKEAAHIVPVRPLFPGGAIGLCSRLSCMIL